ncbi:hypothetical protein HZS_1745 [Henneguya salminicola]|nr:hypothetical protein HZS_1745 [Henneguya salminicola]
MSADWQENIIHWQLSPNGIDGKIMLSDKSEIFARFPKQFQVSSSGYLYIVAKVDRPNNIIVEKVIELTTDEFGLLVLFNCRHGFLSRCCQMHG